MGTRFTADGEKPKNKITLGASGGDNVAPRKVDPATGKTDRSFAQPNPSLSHPTPAPKAHGSAEEAVEALERNSTEGRSYRETNPLVDEVLGNDEQDGE